MNVDRDRNVRLRLLLVVSLIAVMFGSTDALLAKSKARRTATKRAPAAAAAMATQKPPLVEQRETPVATEDDDARTAEVQAGPPVNPEAPVGAVLSPPLSEIPPIPWWAAQARKELEPPEAEPPSQTDTSKPSFTQNFQGPQSSAPTPTGVSFDGVGVGLAGFAPNSNPPETNGRVGATQKPQLPMTTVVTPCQGEMVSIRSHITCAS